jgi:hypothetical protein
LNRRNANIIVDFSLNNDLRMLEKFLALNLKKEKIMKENEPWLSLD